MKWFTNLILFVVAVWAICFIIEPRGIITRIITTTIVHLGLYLHKQLHKHLPH